MISASIRVVKVPGRSTTGCSRPVATSRSCSSTFDFPSNGSSLSVSSPLILDTTKTIGFFALTRLHHPDTTLRRLKALKVRRRSVWDRKALDLALDRESGIDVALPSPAPDHAGMLRAAIDKHRQRHAQRH
jgi:hypothetical protein